MRPKVVLRKNKGSALSYNEMDGNFEELEKSQVISSFIFGSGTETNWNGQGSIITYPGNVQARGYIENVEILNSNAITVDFVNGSGLSTRTATDTITFSGINYIPGSKRTIRIISGTSERTLNFPTGWVFVGSKPSSILSSKTGMLMLTSFGSTESNCVAHWIAQE